jgi:hypothetical protein
VDGRPQMPSIKCTAKLVKRSGLKLDVPKRQSPDDWHANIFTFDRRFYVIFVHDTTRLTCLAGPVKKADLQDMETLLKGSLQTVLIHEGFGENAMAYALSKIADMQICKTDNRSVLGTINDNLFHITHHAAYGGGVESAGLATLAAQVNHMPLSPLKWTYAIKEYRQSVLHSAAQHGVRG